MSATTSHQVRRILKLTIGAAAILLLLKLILAAILDLYSDEIFYWLESTQPALAYSDLPFVTASLAGLLAALDPGNSLLLRLPFLLLGSSLPLLVWWVASAATSREQAMESALLSLCLPLGGFLGLLAVPDVPLIILGLAAVACFQRALRQDHIVWWLGSGVFVALGLSTHYRFVLYPAAAILFLIFYSPARQHWRNPRLWFSLALGACGIIPILWFNLNNELSSVSFYFVERHPWEFQASGLLHLFKQAGVVSPPLYIMLWVTAWHMFKQARSGNEHAALLLCIALLHLLVYLVLAPWADSSSTSLHWPISGYLPLLVFLPQSLRELHGWLQKKYQPALAYRLTLSIPLIGFLGSLVALAGIGSQAFQLPLQGILGTGILSNKMAGWQEFAQHSEDLLATRFPDEAVVLVTDNYYTAAQLGFYQVSDKAYTIDQDKAVRDGRFVQMEIWRRGESALGEASGNTMLFITEDSTLNIPDKIQLLQRACAWTDQMQQIDRLRLFAGDKQFSFYQGNSIRPAGNESAPAFPCPYPPLAWIDLPQAGASLSGDYQVSGWAYAEDQGVSEIYLVIDGERVKQLQYGISRQDVVDIQEVRSDPNRPDLGYSGLLDTRQFDSGRHRLAIEIIDGSGFSSFYGERSILIEN